MRTPLRPISAIAVGAAAVALACVGENPDVEAPHADASNPDATGGPDAAAGDAMTDAPIGGGLFSNADFELGCAAWQDYYSSVTEDTVARSGSRSCRVCKGGTAYYFIQQSVSRPLLPGERYFASAWVRTVDGTPAEPVGAVMQTRDRASVTIDYAESARISISGDWSRVTGLLSIGSDAGEVIDVRFGSSFATDPNCFLIDDASLEKLP
jgi:hypothetical protein